MSYLTIGGRDVSDYVKGLRVGYETLVAENSGRNAAGNTVLDIVNRKVKLYVTFRPMNDTEMKYVLESFSNFVISVKYRDSKTNTIQEITCYTGTPEPEYYWILDNGQVLYREMQLNFIEM